jgi:glucose/arabinose dehydrogenase/mono/diheme cytochrome c family protein
MNPSSYRRAPAAIAVLLVSLITSPAALIHRWSFNETSGTNFADTVGSAPATLVVQAGGSGHVLNGTAARLNGGTRSTSDFINIPNHVFNGLTDVTIEIWAEPHAFLNWSRLIDMGTGDAAPNPTTDNFRLSWSVGLNGNQQRFGLRPYAASDSALITPVNQIYHYAIVWSATGGPGGQAQISWYRDGNFVTNQVVGTATIATIANLAQKEIWLGRSPFTADDTANASYHEMRIYSHVLTPAEIALNTLKGPDNTGPDGVDGLLHRWSFSETSGTVLADSVGGATGQVISPGGGGGTNVLADGQLRLFGGAKATSDYVEFPGGLLEGLENVTVEVWATPVSAKNWSRLWDFGSGVDNAGTWFLSLTRGTDINLQRMEFLPHTLNTALPTALNQQYHYVGIWSASGGPGGGGRMAWYRDGILVGEVDTGTTTVAAVNDAVFWLGRSSWPDETADAFFNEVRLYNRALTPGEINFNRLNGPDNVTIPPVNTVADSATLNPGAKVLLNVLANDTGATANPASVEIVTPPSSGTAIVKSDGTILYAHNGNATTFDAFTYRAQNYAGETSAVATVTLTITNALRLAATSLTLPSAAPPTILQVVDALPGVTFDEPICLTTILGDLQRLFVAERMARVMVVPDVTAAQPTNLVFLDLQQVVAGRNPVETIANWSLGENGLLGLAFHPGYATNGYFYAAYTVRINNGSFYQRISRFSVSPGNPNQADPGSELILLQQLDRGFNHNGGDLHFGPDGYLYYAAGDEENPNDFRLNSQFINKGFHAGIFRFDVDKRPGNLAPNPHASIPTDEGVARFAVPLDNPFVHTSLGGTWDGTYNGITNVSSGSDPNLTTIRTEFWATGLRHPWRMSFDSLTGDLWAGDVGQGTYEEINLIVRGGNYGWVYREGAHDTGLRAPVPPGFTSIDPVYEYVHTGIAGGDPQFKGNSVCGGVVYRGTRFANLYGHYIWCDSVSGHIWGRNPDNGTVTRLTGVPGAYGGLVSMGIDPSNQDVLFCDYINGRILRLAGGTVANWFPETLSDTGAFADLTDLSPSPGLVAYDPIVPFWSDHAIKSRWFAIPNLTDTVTHVTDGNWTLPTGMVWVKHFDLELERGNPATKQRLETRFLVKTTNGTYGVSYAWNAAGTEAYLVPDSGTNFSLTITNGAETFGQQWGIPSRNECLACHTEVGGHALSFNTRQLNQVAAMNHLNGNQLSLLSAAGYFANPVNAPQTLPAFSRADDSAVSLEHRVRSYLSVNCVQCHQSGGGAPATWDARAWLSLDATSLLNGLPNNNGGNPDNKLIVPGDTAHSIVLQRLRANGFSRMPPLATTVIDEAATNLLHLWISTELTNRQTFAQWQLAIFGSTNSANALALADPDGDGANNYYEYVTQTSPTNAVPAPWTISIDEAAGTVGVSFQRLANLGFLVETSTDFSSWELWDVPENILWFSATSFPDLITGPLAGPNRYYRVRLVEP